MTIQDYVEEVVSDFEAMVDVWKHDGVDIRQYQEDILNDSVVINECYAESVPVETCVNYLCEKHVFQTF